MVSGATSWYNVTSYGATGNGSTDNTRRHPGSDDRSRECGRRYRLLPAGDLPDLVQPASSLEHDHPGERAQRRPTGSRQTHFRPCPSPNLLAVSSPVSRVIIQDLGVNGNSANITYNGGYNYLHGGTTVGYTNLQGIYILNSDDVTVQEHPPSIDCFSSGIMAQGSRT